MSDRQALLLAIRAAPDDDLPRLAYADWLDENGDAARAQLIRLQCVMAKADRYEPEHWELKRHERELHDEHEQHWRKDLPALRQIDWGPFVRGFVDGVTAESYRAFRREAKCVRGTIHLRWLGLRVDTRLRSFKDPECLDGIEALSLYGPPGPLGCRCVPALAAMPPLRSLRSLFLYGLLVDAAGAAALAASPHLAGLEHLELGANPGLGAPAGLALARSPHLHRLRRLGLSEAQIGDFAAEELFAGAAARLKRLSLGNNRLTDYALVALARSSARELEELSLAHNSFTAAGVRELLDSPAVGRLRLLSLSGHRLGDGLAEAVAQAPGLRELRALSLVGCGIGPAGARALAESPHLGNLRSLSLSVNQIGDEGAAALAAAPWMGQLRTFGLTHNAVGDAGMLALARVRSARLLQQPGQAGLEGNPISDAAWEKALRTEAAP